VQETIENKISRTQVTSFHALLDNSSSIYDCLEALQQIT